MNMLFSLSRSMDSQLERWITCSVRQFLGAGLKPPDFTEIHVSFEREARKFDRIYPYPFVHIYPDPYLSIPTLVYPCLPIFTHIRWYPDLSMIVCPYLYPTIYPAIPLAAGELQFHALQDWPTGWQGVTGIVHQCFLQDIRSMGDLQDPKIEVPTSSTARGGGGSFRIGNL